MSTSAARGAGRVLWVIATPLSQFRMCLNRWSVGILVLQAVLFALYLGSWLDPNPTDDVTLDYVVFVASPLIFGLALALGVLGHVPPGGSRERLFAVVGNALMLLCLVASVGWLLLLSLSEVLFRLD